MNCTPCVMNEYKNYILLLGGNVGDVKSTFTAAKALLVNYSVEIVKESSLYATEPWEMYGADFLNQAIEIKTALKASALMSILLEIENMCGRYRSLTEKYTSRTLDIDIIHAYEKTENSETVKIPHPRMHLRKFTLVPVCELTPEWEHPIFKKSCLQLLEECGDTSLVTKLS